MKTNLPVTRNEARFPKGHYIVSRTDLKGITTYVNETFVEVSGFSEKELVGKGVCYCATCDGMLYRDKPVAVIAYTEEGEHEANFLGEICPVVYFIPQYKTEFQPSQPTVQVLKARPKAVLGTDEVTGLETDAGELKVDGIFILRQSDPAETLLPELEMDGPFVKVNRDQATNVPGVYAAGDCTGKPWQIARATGEGLTAVLNAITYIDSKK